MIVVTTGFASSSLRVGFVSGNRLGRFRRNHCVRQDLQRLVTNLKDPETDSDQAMTDFALVGDDRLHQQEIAGVAQNILRRR